jgi:hypothetical protein
MCFFLDQQLANVNVTLCVNYRINTPEFRGSGITCKNSHNITRTQDLAICKPKKIYLMYTCDICVLEHYFNEVLTRSQSAISYMCFKILNIVNS